MKRILFSLILSSSILSCGNNGKDKTTIESDLSFKNTGHKLVFEMVQKVGDYNELRNKEDVVYTYTYQTPDAKTDISTEKYVFDGELSYGAYKKHERTLPQLEGLIEQGYDGEEFWLKHNGKIVKNDEFLKRVAFNRPTNFYWFAMMPKLLDEGLNYDYLGEKTIESKKYDIVKVTFNKTEKKPSDIYQLYINKKTKLVDQFLFTVVDYDVIDTPYLMVVEYENIDGLLLPTRRKYKKSSWNADITDAPWTKVTWSNIRFQNNFVLKDFSK